MEEFSNLFEPQGTAEGCGHREAVRYSPVGSSAHPYILFLWIDLIYFGLVFLLSLIPFRIVTLLALIAVKNVWLSLGSRISILLLTIVVVVVSIALILNSIFFNLSSNGLLIPYMDTESSLL